MGVCCLLPSQRVTLLLSISITTFDSSVCQWVWYISVAIYGLGMCFWFIEMNQCSLKPVVSRLGCELELFGEAWGKICILWMTPDLDNQRLLRWNLETTLQAPQGILMQPAQHLSENQSLGTTMRDHYQGWTMPELGLAVSGRISCLAVKSISSLPRTWKRKGEEKRDLKEIPTSKLDYPIL